MRDYTLDDFRQMVTRPDGIFHAFDTIAQLIATDRDKVMVWKNALAREIQKDGDNATEATTVNRVLYGMIFALDFAPYVAVVDSAVDRSGYRHEALEHANDHVHIKVCAPLDPEKGDRPEELPIGVVQALLIEALTGFDAKKKQGLTGVMRGEPLAMDMASPLPDGSIVHIARVTVSIFEEEPLTRH